MNCLGSILANAVDIHLINTERGDRALTQKERDRIGLDAGSILCGIAGGTGAALELIDLKKFDTAKKLLEGCDILGTFAVVIAGKYGLEFALRVI
jgi:hypothetical protein